MLNYDLDKMIYTLPADQHSVEEIRETLVAHPEVKFVSLVGIDVGGRLIQASRFHKGHDRGLRAVVMPLGGVSARHRFLVQITHCLAYSFLSAV